MAVLWTSCGRLRTNKLHLQEMVAKMNGGLMEMKDDGVISLGLWFSEHPMVVDLATRMEDIITGLIERGELEDAHKVLYNLFDMGGGGSGSVTEQMTIVVPDLKTLPMHRAGDECLKALRAQISDRGCRPATMREMAAVVSMGVLWEKPWWGESLGVVGDDANEGLPVGVVVAECVGHGRYLYPLRAEYMGRTPLLAVKK